MRCGTGRCSSWTGRGTIRSRRTPPSCERLISFPLSFFSSLLFLFSSSSLLLLISSPLFSSLRLFSLLLISSSLFLSLLSSLSVQGSGTPPCEGLRVHRKSSSKATPHPAARLPAHLRPQADQDRGCAMEVGVEGHCEELCCATTAPSRRPSLRKLRPCACCGFVHHARCWSPPPPRPSSCAAPRNTSGRESAPKRWHVGCRQDRVALSLWCGLLHREIPRGVSRQYGVTLSSPLCLICPTLLSSPRHSPLLHSPLLAPLPFFSQRLSVHNRVSFSGLPHVYTCTPMLALFPAGRLPLRTLATAVHVSKHRPSAITSAVCAIADAVHVANIDCSPHTQPESPRLLQGQCRSRAEAEDRPGLPAAQELCGVRHTAAPKR